VTLGNEGPTVGLQGPAWVTLAARCASQDASDCARLMLLISDPEVGFRQLVRWRSMIEDPKAGLQDQECSSY
jgi:hypothetical protein